jgi:hypothetical protein
MGTAHAGHDQCARCYFDYIKPALQAERLAVKRRKELKRLHLAPATRALINEVDLKEPQMVDRDVERDPLPIRPSKAIRDAIYDIELDRLIENKTEEEALEAVSAELLKIDLGSVPVSLPRPLLKPQPEEVMTPEPEPLTRHVHAGGQDSHLTERQVAEVVDAYVDGMTVMAICDVCNIATTTLYAILRERGVPLRGRPSTQRWTNRTPESLTIKLKGTPQSTMPVSEPKVEPAPVNGVVSGLTEWVVTYTVTRTETTIVAARSFNDAAATVTDGDVISVAKKLP